MTGRWFFLLTLAATTWILGSPAHAGSGTLKGSFVYKNPSTGVETKLNAGYVYLHSAVKPPPMEKLLSKADLILALPANPFTLSVPAGSYYIRLLQRQDLSVSRPYGPPHEGDYTWVQQPPINIVSGATLDLGKKYATTYSASPVIISGTVKTAAGAPLAGHYVRAQVEPCLTPVNCTDSGCQQYGNQCGSVKYLALAPTDAAGKYTLYLADPGKYYLYASPCLMRGHNLNDDDTRCQFNAAAPTPFTVNLGDRVTVDIAAD